MDDIERKAKTTRWYDRDDTVSKSMNMLNKIPDSLKRQVATFLVEDIINRKPYKDMFTLDTHYLILSEDRRNRWYDFDETIHIFVELLRHTSDDRKKELADLVIDFITSLADFEGIKLETMDD